MSNTQMCFHQIDYCAAPLTLQIYESLWIIKLSCCRCSMVNLCPYFPPTNNLLFLALFILQIYKATNYTVSINNHPFTAPHGFTNDRFALCRCCCFSFWNAVFVASRKEKKKPCINLPARQFCICCEQHLLCCLVGGDKQPFKISCSAFREERVATADSFSSLLMEIWLMVDACWSVERLLLLPFCFLFFSTSTLH